MQPKIAIFNRSDLEYGFPRHPLYPYKYKTHNYVALQFEIIEAVLYTQAISASTMDLCTFDFQAARESERDFVSLERLDEQLNVVLLVDFSQGKYSNINLWGEKMGTNTALLYALKHQKLICMILDSPFISLEEVNLNLIKDKLGTHKRMTYYIIHNIIRTDPTIIQIFHLFIQSTLKFEYQVFHVIFFHIVISLKFQNHIMDKNKSFISIIIIMNQDQKISLGK
ncbi:unnamed protein product [Paramecium octaurelia]|uniref:Uncharacterized protein n=1 Tax=Paramecium octaurelia TaxID=43137 RepID=A0A8S1YDP8_PAROT|nr:unnamed protein product [Paramecium octaurelia]